MPSSNASSLIEPSTYETQFEPHTDDEDNLWSVLEIVKEYRGKYLVKWEGFDPDTGKPWAPSWVPKYDCTDELIHDWKTKKAKKDQRRKKKRKSDGDLGK
ncbi:hypothetical protein K439DRAFT_1362563 [Ramaria rubella]|nr:hypothetical protein K439DRAFT_1362563 [Ramaria rubella]